MALRFSLSLSLSILSFFLFYFSRRVYGLEGNFSVFLVDDHTRQANCSLSQAPDGARTLKIVHRHGPCSPTNDDGPSVLETLAQDSLRVASLQARLAGKAAGNEIIPEQNGVSVAVSNGLYLGTLTYVITIGLGSPKVAQTVVIDTGSDVCWVQCSPCSSCFPQEETLFDPSSSSSYGRISCDSRACTNLELQACSSSSCIYGVRYLDGTNTTGFLSTEKLTLTPDDVFQGFIFGCGYNNHGLKGVAGLVGLGQGPYSLASQTAFRLGNVFSYCFPLRTSSTGWLTLGGRSASAAVYYTPILSDPRAPSFYFVDLVGISVGGTTLPVTADEFRAVGTIIDSGTTLTYLPPAAYSALRAAFQRAMSRYTRIQGIGSLDTCYDFSNESQVEYPGIELEFTGVVLTLKTPGVLFSIGNSQYCLAFAATGGASIVGNAQQQGLEVIYDIGGKRIGFAAGACG